MTSYEQMKQIFDRDGVSYTEERRETYVDKYDDENVIGQPCVVLSISSIGADDIWGCIGFYTDFVFRQADGSLLKIGIFE